MMNANKLSQPQFALTQRCVTSHYAVIGVYVCKPVNAYDVGAELS